MSFKVVNGNLHLPFMHVLEAWIRHVFQFSRSQSVLIWWGFTKHLTQIHKIFCNLGLKILRLFKLLSIFEADIIKG